MAKVVRSGWAAVAALPVRAGFHRFEWLLPALALTIFVATAGTATAGPKYFSIRMGDKLIGYAGLCPRVIQSGDTDRRGPLTKHGPRYLRWAYIEAAIWAARHPAYTDRHQRIARRLGPYRGPKVARIDTARRLTKATWWMLKRHEPFRPAGPNLPLVA